jgi:hypothetical protein
MNHQQNNRTRNSRPANPRRESDPLSRIYDSNGPDVRIRGTARHIAEKYLQLARDAHTGGNAVAAENYLQHAEHYFRLIAAALGPRAVAEDETRDYEGDNEDRRLSARFSAPPERAPQPQPQQQPQPYPRPARFVAPAAVAADEDRGAWPQP